MAKAKKLDDSQLEAATGGVASNMGADASMGDQSIPGQDQKGAAPTHGKTNAELHQMADDFHANKAQSAAQPAK